MELTLGEVDHGPQSRRGGPLELTLGEIDLTLGEMDLTLGEVDLGPHHGYWNLLLERRTLELIRGEMDLGPPSRRGAPWITILER